MQKDNVVEGCSPNRSGYSRVPWKNILQGGALGNGEVS